MEEITLCEKFNCSPMELYRAWMDPVKHQEMTGSEAQISPDMGAEFTAWGGYIQGRNQELVAGRKIVQSWRTSDFKETDPDSLLEILLDEDGGKTLLTLNHTKIPDGEGDNYRQGWIDFYFEPMKVYFNS